MTNRGIQRALGDLVDVPVTVAVGQVTAIETDDAWGYLATVTLQPSGDVVQARIATAGGGSHVGLFWPLAVDDEVVVLLPEGDPNRAVITGWLPSTAAAIPSSWDNGRPRLVHAHGLTLQTSETASVQAVVLEALLPALADALTEVQTLMLGLGFPAPDLATLLAALPTQYRSKAVTTE